MTCSKCGAQFCYVCLKLTSHHDWTCNDYEERLKVDANLKKVHDETEKAKANIERYKFYWERYDN